ncbi:UDP-n-acetylglucosamine transferase subunit alg13 homolog [Plakobranchus ocellatus]|uniref:UDP-N-acetylglucosamine transferase subunit ALG13 n=1 Tax=Plakobranchus ocellatus TaxID=259542 RepID=A0AAV4AHE2_9GAST|nr:UDP-n-acetylglucosamine transferase subunit alg13 homolog [Plakobranchus ocellatus]
MEKKLFVTVGTTQFDTLIEAISSKEIMEVLSNLGFTHVTLQTGRGKVQPKDNAGDKNHPSLTCYGLKNSILEDVKAADLVICHAGAGSILDALGCNKKVLVVVNEELMGNHQTEVAEKLAKEHYLHFCGISSLSDSLKNLDFSNLVPFPPGEPEKFASHLDQVLGFS